MLKIEHINKVFAKGTINETTLFNDFNLQVPTNQFLSIVGSNGSGKTTLLSIICGSIGVDSGKVTLDNKDITKLKEYKRSKIIGRVYQDPSLGSCSSMTILENMALFDNKNKPYNLTSGINKKRIDFYKSQLFQLKLGLEDKLNVVTGSLSGGQRQALALLCATMTDIDLLILDEHTAALDPNSSATIMELTEKIVKEKNITTLMVTHNLKFAVDYGQRLIMMDKGKIIKDCDKQNSPLSIDDLLATFNQISIECGN